jgi:hypothetical protein
MTALGPAPSHRAATADELPSVALGASGAAVALDAEITWSIGDRAIDPRQ